MKTPPTIYYKELVEDYNKNLSTVLRGFKPAFDFLESWVHSEDDYESILNLIESAYEAGELQITLVLDSDTTQKIDLDRLKEWIQRLGRVTTESQAKGLALKISFELAEALKEINPLYRKKLQEILAHCSHEGQLSSAADTELVQASYQGLTLMAQVVRTSHTVKRASFVGATTPIHRGLLEKLCRLIEGKQIQECSEHACIYLEFELREPLQGPVLSGIVMPENADPAFLVPLRLVRQLFEKYKELSGYKIAWNFFHPSPSLEWRALSQAEKENKLEQAIEGFCQEVKLPSSAIQLLSFQHQVRVTVGFEGSFTSHAKQKLLMDLEKALKDRLEKTIEVYTEELKDLNAIRRLAKPEKLASAG